MKKYMLSVLIFFFAAPAFADEVYDACIANIDMNGLPDGVSQTDSLAGCSCVSDAVSGDEDLTAELLELAGMSDADIEAQRSGEAGDVLDACFGA